VADAIHTEGVAAAVGISAALLAGAIATEICAFVVRSTGRGAGGAIAEKVGRTGDRIGRDTTPAAIAGALRLEHPVLTGLAWSTGSTGLRHAGAGRVTVPLAGEALTAGWIAITRATIDRLAAGLLVLDRAAPASTDHVLRPGLAGAPVLLALSLVVGLAFPLPASLLAATSALFRFSLLWVQHGQ
jgi:hypothetical protein